MARYLVTGGAGFIGSHLAGELARRGHHVVVLDDLSGGSRERVPEEAELVVGSVTDASVVDSVIEAGKIDGVYHLAAFTAEAISHAVMRHNYQTNLIGSVNLINSSLREGTRFFGFASSVGVYGRGRTPMREDDTAEPVDSYGLAKLVVERELAAAMRTHGLAFTAFRMHNVYGEWQNMHDPYRNAVAIFLNQILRGEPMTIYGSGQQVRAFTYINDILPVLADAPDTPAAWGQVFNLGGSQTHSILGLVDHVAHAMGVPNHPVVHLPMRDEVTAAYTDVTRARSVFGAWDETPLATGLARTAAWARSHGPADLRASFALELDGALTPDWVRHIEQRVRP